VSVEVAWASASRRPRGLGDARVRQAATAAARHGGRDELELSIVFVGDGELARMHAEWLDDPTPTDVITFDLGDDAGGPAGELYVSTERARAVARRRGTDVVGEHLLYVVHGVLHLCGYDDGDSRGRARMRRAERAVMRELEGERGRRSGDAASRRRASPRAGS
jgi:probable rRNA maturation factor